MQEPLKEDICKAELAAELQYRQEIPAVVQEIISSCQDKGCFDHISPEPLPSLNAAIHLVEKARIILYPGYFTAYRVDQVNFRYYLGQEITAFFEALSEQIALCFRHECLRYDLPCAHCREKGEQSALEFIRQIPTLRTSLSKDVRAAYEGDPAAKSFDEVIFSYPGLLAITVYRVAHQLCDQGIPLMPRMMTEYAHSMTGIDIHPGAQIGDSFFIDHGTGVVIGETTTIGNRVRIYQGVTLGALSVSPGEADKLRNKKRHPSIEDDVIIYSGATILGGGTLIGARSIIGGNVWITQSVPPDTQVFGEKPALVFRMKPR